jgi:hypothetical protein
MILASAKHVDYFLQTTTSITRTAPNTKTETENRNSLLRLHGLRISCSVYVHSTTIIKKSKSCVWCSWADALGSINPTFPMVARHAAHQWHKHRPRDGTMSPRARQRRESSTPNLRGGGRVRESEQTAATDLRRDRDGDVPCLPARWRWELFLQIEERDETVWSLRIFWMSRDV